MTRMRITRVGATIALGCALAGCTSPAPDSDPVPSVTPTPSATSTPDPSPTDPDPGTDPAEPTEDADALPPGFPDPAGLVGQEASEERTADGTWRTVVGGRPLDLRVLLGACFDGGTDDVCAYSISASVPPSVGDTPAASEAALLLLLRSAGARADGTPTWQVLDAIITRTPDGAPAYLETCDGASGVAIYAEAGVAPASTVPVAAAWGPNADISALVEVDPASLTCAYVGD